MIILGFESSCDETSVAVVKREESGELRILSNIVASQVPIHRKYGGVVPEIASRAHVEAISEITHRALETAGVTVGEIDLVSVTDHPGLIGALLVAVNFAKGFAFANRKPLVGVSHIQGHIAACYLAGNGEVPKPPFLSLVVSGGHTSIYRVASYTELEEIGGTRDDAMGESFDKIGRIIGIPYPAGAGFDALAAEGMRMATGLPAPTLSDFSRSAAAKDPSLSLPSPALAGDTLDFSFSGLKTAAINLIHRTEQRGETLRRELLAAVYTREAVEAVAAKLRLALSRYPGEGLAVAGGVAANSHLRKRLAELTLELGVPLFIPPLSLCGDNAAMIAAAGYYEYLAGHLADSSLSASALDDPRAI